jgi:hypothetical protein
MNGSLSMAASTWPFFNAAGMVGMGTSTSSTSLRASPFFLRTDATATSLMPLRVLTATFLPLRSATLAISGSRVISCPDPSSMTSSDARAPTDTIVTGTPFSRATRRLTMLE